MKSSEKRADPWITLKLGSNYTARAYGFDGDLEIETGTGHTFCLDRADLDRLKQASDLALEWWPKS